jgi:hypothetical protein
VKNFIIKNYTYLIIKSFNKNKFIALLISGTIIFSIKYYLNYFGYITDLSLIFICFCILIKSISLVIVEYIRESNFEYIKSSNKYFYYTYINTYKSKNNDTVTTFSNNKKIKQAA